MTDEAVRPKTKGVSTPCFQPKKYNNMTNRNNWENEIIQAISTELNCSISDSAAIVEANPFYLNQSWGKGLSSEEAANVIINMSKVG